MFTTVTNAMIKDKPVQVCLSHWLADHQTWTVFALWINPEKKKKIQVIVLLINVTNVQSFTSANLRITGAQADVSPVFRSMPSSVCWGGCAFWFWTGPQIHPDLPLSNWCGHFQSSRPPEMKYAEQNIQILINMQGVVLITHKGLHTHTSEESFALMPHCPLHAAAVCSWPVIRNNMLWEVINAIKAILESIISVLVQTLLKKSCNLNNCATIQTVFPFQCNCVWRKVESTIRHERKPIWASCWCWNEAKHCRFDC